MSQLKDLCELIVDCEHKTAPTQETGYPSIRTPNVGRGRLILDGVNRVSEETYHAWTQREVPQPSDLILAREAPIGNVAIVPPGLKLCLGQRTVLIRPDRRFVNPQYLTYLLLGDEIQGKILSISNGATVHHLNMKDIRELEMRPLPTPQIQDRIADILSGYDDLIENNTRRIIVLENMAQLLYREWFVNFRFPGHRKVRMVQSELGPIPAGWMPKRLGDLCSETRRGVDPGEIDPATPYIGLEHLPRKSIALGEWGRAGDVGSTKLRFKRGEILFGKIRPYFHKVGVAPIDGVASSDAIVIVPNDPAYFGLVLCCVSSEDFVRHATQTSQGTKMPRANWDVLTKYPLPLPSGALLKQFNGIIHPTVEMLQNLVFRNRNLRTTRDFLMPKLISGEIPVEAVAGLVEQAV
jgi:type I restriction enzyme, S subunit